MRQEGNGTEPEHYETLHIKHSLFNRGMLSDKTKREFDLCVIPGCHFISWLIPISAQCNSLDITNTGCISHMLFFLLLLQVFVFLLKLIIKLYRCISEFSSKSLSRNCTGLWAILPAPPPQIFFKNYFNCWWIFMFL